MSIKEFIIYAIYYVHWFPMSNSQIETVSLFSGAGGLDIGSELNGVKVRVAIDIDHDSIETLKLNNSGKKKYIIKKKKFLYKWG